MCLWICASVPPGRTAGGILWACGFWQLPHNGRGPDLSRSSCPLRCMNNAPWKASAVVVVVTGEYCKSGNRRLAMLALPMEADGRERATDLAGLQRSNGQKLGPRRENAQSEVAAVLEACFCVAQSRRRHGLGVPLDDDDDDDDGGGGDAARLAVARQRGPSTAAPEGGWAGRERCCAMRLLLRRPFMLCRERRDAQATHACSCKAVPRRSSARAPTWTSPVPEQDQLPADAAHHTGNRQRLGRFAPPRPKGTHTSSLAHAISSVPDAYAAAGSRSIFQNGAKPVWSRRVHADGEMTGAGHGDAATEAWTTHWWLGLMGTWIRRPHRQKMLYLP
ncbi:hypothetical protein IQ07DRAFT_600590 [Pyrenochaeta sp. DS3sAY3a]|nr:hypothetical protein IQ07DRAFT_600590 [Pyrenochaeta sp. DS3sAY3a]